MAADQRRKRLNGASIVGCSSREQHRTKRKNAGVTQSDLKMKSHISVQWDGHQKKVVAKREQIGISWRNMSPFINSSQHNHNVLADIFTVPTEIFGLNNLTDLLSYETWQNYLTENERNHLSQFLPKELDRDQVVQDLLNCKNFHFGNPFLKWGASLCSGDFHPDAIVSQEKHLKSNKKLHYSELREYHNDMIKFLMKLKERWESCEDLEMDIVQNLRSGNGEERRDSSRVNELPATSESGSWVADEIACSSDNQFSSLIKGEKPQRRILDKDMRGKRGGSLFSSDDTIDTVSAPKEGHKLMKRNIHSSDGAKYMSYIKITKRQLELVRSMKKTGQSIQVKSLNRILGDLDGLQVQPYEVFVEEEQKNLRDSWLHLVNEDIPSAYAFWRERQMQIVRMKNLTEEEILEKVKPPIEDEENGSLGSDDRQDQEDGEATNEECSGGESEGSSPRSAEDQSPQEIFSPSSADDFTFVGTNSGKYPITSRLDEAPQPNTKYSSNVNAQDIPVNQEVSTSSGGPVWQSVCVPHSCFESTTVDLDYSSVNGFSIANPQINEQRESRLIDLEIDMHQEGAKRELLHGYSDDGSFSSYANQEQNDILQSHLEQKHLQSRREQKSPNQPRRDSNDLLQAHRERNGLPQCYQDHSNIRSHQNQPDLLQTQQKRNDLLHSLFRDPVILSHHEQNGTGLNFQRHADVMMNNGFSGHFKESLQPSMTLEQGQKRPDEMYLGEHIAEDVYPDGGRFLPARQGHLSSVNVAWAVATGCMPEPSQSHLNSAEFLGQHWFPTDQIRGGWTEFDGVPLPTNTVGSGTSTDQGLYSVLSQCNQLKSSIPYNSVRPSDQFIPPRTYGVMDTLAPRINSPAPQPSHPLDFLSGRESGNSLVPDDLSWMSLPPHSSALHDQLGKPFVRSWNG